MKNNRFEDIVSVKRMVIEEMPDCMKVTPTIKYTEVLKQIPNFTIHESDTSLMSYKTLDGYVDLKIEDVYYVPKYNEYGKYKWFKKLLNKLFVGHYVGSVSMRIIGDDTSWNFDTVLTTKTLHVTMNTVNEYIKALHDKYKTDLRRAKKIQLRERLYGKK